MRYTCSFVVTLIFYLFLLQGYDAHMLIRALAKHEDDVRDIRITATNMEKYITIVNEKFRLDKLLIIYLYDYTSQFNVIFLILLTIQLT